MVRFRRSALDEMLGRIRSLGLNTCPICNSAELAVWSRPGMLQIGGPHYGRSHPDNDPDSNVLFMIIVNCHICGHTLLFNSEQLTGSNEGVLIQGVPEDEEEEWEQRQAGSPPQ